MDYKESYIKMMSATQEAIQILAKAKQECEDMRANAEANEIASLHTNEELSE